MQQFNVDKDASKTEVIAHVDDIASLPQAGPGETPSITPEQVDDGVVGEEPKAPKAKVPKAEAC